MKLSRHCADYTMPPMLSSIALLVGLLILQPMVQACDYVVLNSTKTIVVARDMVRRYVMVGVER